MENNYSDIAPYVTALRRELHEHPELSMQEHWTSRRIKQELDRLGIAYSELGETALWAVIPGDRGPGLAVALRADLDALPVQEQTGLPFASKQPGCMHACGHDAHMSVLLGAAKLLSERKDRFAGQVRLIFESGEEVGGSARMIAESAAMEGVGTVFGAHVTAELPVGQVSLDPGPRMAGCGMFQVYLTGLSSHGARPHQGVDAVVAAAACVMNLQSIVSREVNPLEPCVLTVGKLEAGTAQNVLAGQASLYGTLRYFDAQVGRQVMESIRRVAQETAAAYRCQARVEHQHTADPVISDAACCQVAREALRRADCAQAVHMPMAMTSETFYAYLNRVPGVFAFLGVRSQQAQSVYPIHNDRFTVDEDALWRGSALFAEYALTWLEQHTGQ